MISVNKLFEQLRPGDYPKIFKTELRQSLINGNDMDGKTTYDTTQFKGKEPSDLEDRLDYGKRYSSISNMNTPQQPIQKPEVGG